MSHFIAGRRKRQIELLRTQFAQREGLPFAEVLPAERVEQALRKREGPGGTVLLRRRLLCRHF